MNFNIFVFLTVMKNTAVKKSSFVCAEFFSRGKFEVPSHISSTENNVDIENGDISEFLD